MRLERVDTGTPTHPGQARDPFETRYLTDMSTAYHHTYQADAVTHSFGALALGIIQVTEPFDLVVLAQAIPDPRPLQSSGCLLGSLLPGRPIVYGVSDQGALAPFTALRLALAHQARHALVLAAEREGMTALTLRGGSSGPRDLAVRQIPDVAADQVTAVVAAELARVAGDRPAVLVAGQGIGALPASGARVIDAPARGNTGLWSRLAAITDAPDAGRIVIAAYEPAVRGVGIAVIGEA